MKDAVVMRIGEAARRIGISARRIIEYERAGLLKPARQPRTGDRVFTPHDLEQVRRINRLLHGGGFTITALVHLARMVPCWKFFDCTRSDCAAYLAPRPCWQVAAAGDGCACAGTCRQCVLYLTGRKHVRPVRLLGRPVTARSSTTTTGTVGAGRSVRHDELLGTQKVRTRGGGRKDR